jgi:hypothetical protein
MCNILLAESLVPSTLDLSIHLLSDTSAKSDVISGRDHRAEEKFLFHLHTLDFWLQVNHAFQHPTPITRANVRKQQRTPPCLESTPLKKSLNWDNSSVMAERNNVQAAVFAVLPNYFHTCPQSEISTVRIMLISLKDRKGKTVSAAK